MDTQTLLIASLSFGLSLVFALGGVGCALVLIPTLSWLGVPFAQARPIGLFVNTVGMLGATWSNIRAGRLDYRLGVPIIASSIVLAPVGAWAGHHIPSGAVMLAFVAFLVFSGLMMLFFKGSKYADQYRSDRPVSGPLLTGAAAGLLSGLLGVGGGGLISPLMIFQGFNPKKVAVVTAFAVPFSSFAAFLAYAAMGSVSLKLLAVSGAAAWAGGLLGTIIMHRRMQPATVKRFLGLVLLLMAARMAMKLL